MNGEHKLLDIVNLVTGQKLYLLMVFYTAGIETGLWPKASLLLVSGLCDYKLLKEFISNTIIIVICPGKR